MRYPRHGYTEFDPLMQPLLEAHLKAVRFTVNQQKLFFATAENRMICNVERNIQLPVGIVGPATRNTDDCGERAVVAHDEISMLSRAIRAERTHREQKDCECV